MDGCSAGDGSVLRGRERWHEAADRAGFTFFEPVSPDRTAVWAGGFGWATDEPSHLDVIASIDGVEVAVGTRLAGPHRDSDVRSMVLDLLFDYVLARTEVELPMSIEVIADDRVITVAGRDLLFSGVRIEGSGRWVGEAEHDAQVIRVVASAAPPPFSLEPCRDWASMAELPPTGG